MQVTLSESYLKTASFPFDSDRQWGMQIPDVSGIQILKVCCIFECLVFKAWLNTWPEFEVVVVYFHYDRKHKCFYVDNSVEKKLGNMNSWG